MDTYNKSPVFFLKKKESDYLTCCIILAQYEDLYDWLKIWLRRQPTNILNLDLIILSPNWMNVLTVLEITFEITFNDTCWRLTRFHLAVSNTTST